MNLTTDVHCNSRNIKHAKIILHVKHKSITYLFASRTLINGVMRMPFSFYSASWEKLLVILLALITAFSLVKEKLIYLLN